MNVIETLLGEIAFMRYNFSRIFRTIGESCAAEGGTKANVCFPENIIYMGPMATKIEIDEIKW